MRVMVLVKATKDSEAGVMPSTELLEAMGKYNEELVAAGIIRRRSASRPACVSFNLVPPSSNKPHPFRRWIATQSISRSRSSASATCFNVSFSDGLRPGSGVFELSISAGRSLHRTDADHRPVQE